MNWRATSKQSVVIALEELPSCGLRLPIGEQHQALSADLAHLPEYSRANHCNVFDPGARQTSAAAPRPYNGVLRLHLGLIVPEPREQLGIRVEHDVYRWREGEAVIFDDAYEHEAWNYTPHTRVVLFVDFRKPLRFPANVINWLLLHLAMFTPFIREGMDNQKAWEKKFYEEAEALRNR